MRQAKFVICQRHIYIYIHLKISTKIDPLLKRYLTTTLYAWQKIFFMNERSKRGCKYNSSFNLKDLLKTPNTLTHSTLV